jgi:hypothetical protein
MPTREYLLYSNLPQVITHEQGHAFGKLDDEYGGSGGGGYVKHFSNPITGFKRVNAINCLPSSTALNIWDYKTYYDASKRKQSSSYNGCAGGCSDCRDWLKPSANSVMTNNIGEAGSFLFNKASREQYEYFLRRLIGLPYNAMDNNVKACIAAATTYGTVKNKCG